MHRFILDGKDFYETKWFKQGFEAYFRGEPYAIVTTSSDWRAGWLAAESGRVTEGEEDIG